MRKKIGLLAMAILVVLMAMSAQAASSEVGEVIELPSDEVTKEGVTTDMEMWPRKMMKDEGGKGRENACLLIGNACSSDANCLPGCTCRTTLILKLGFCSPF